MCNMISQHMLDQHDDLGRQASCDSEVGTPLLVLMHAAVTLRDQPRKMLVLWAFLAPPSKYCRHHQALQKLAAQVGVQ